MRCKLAEIFFSKRVFVYVLNILNIFFLSLLKMIHEEVEVSFGSQEPNHV